MQRLLFNLGHEKATIPGKRIHSHVCGHIQVTTLSGIRLFKKFMDDFSN